MSNGFDWSIFQNTNAFIEIYEKQNGKQTNEWWVKRLIEIVEMIPDRENWSKRWWWWQMHITRCKKISRLMRKQNRSEK